MDFTFTEDQISFREAVSRFLMTEAAPELLRDIWETESGRSDELLGKIAAQGLTALSVPEAEGGLAVMTDPELPTGSDRVEQALGRHVARGHVGGALQALHLQAQRGQRRAQLMGRIGEEALLALQHAGHLL